MIAGVEPRMIVSFQCMKLLIVFRTCVLPRVGSTGPASDLKDYVGPPVVTSDRRYELTLPGVVMELAWAEHHSESRNLFLKTLIS